MSRPAFSMLWKHGRAAISVAACAMAISGSSPAAAAYPDRDITMIIPFGVGGGSDILARTIANVIEEMKLMPVKLLPENRPGSSGAVGYTALAKQKGSPYTVATVSVSFFTTPLQGGSPVTYRDFTPLAGIALSPYIVVVPASSEFKSIDDLKKVPRLTTGTTGVVSDAALLARMTSNALGMKIDPIPFDGEGEIMSALLGGHIALAYFNPSEVMEQIRAGTLRPLAVSSPQRIPALKDVPTFTELGYKIVHTQIRGLVMPKDVPPEAVTYWEGVLRKVAESEPWRKQYIDRFYEVPQYLDSKAFGQAIVETSNRYETLMKELGIIK